MSARPQVSPPSIRSGWRITGMIGRVIRFQPVGDLDRHHRLDVEHVLGAAGVRRVLGAVAEVQIVLQRQADQIGDRVLRLLGELERVVTRGRRWSGGLLCQCRPRGEEGREEQQPGRSLDAFVHASSAPRLPLSRSLAHVARCHPGQAPSSSSLLANCSAHALKALSTSSQELKVSRPRALVPARSSAPSQSSAPVVASLA